MTAVLSASSHVLIWNITVSLLQSLKSGVHHVSPLNLNKDKPFRIKYQA